MVFDLHITTHVATTYAGSHKHNGRHGLAHNVKDADGSSIVSEGKPLKRGGSSVHGSHEVCMQLNLWCQLELSVFFVWSISNLRGLIIL